MSAQSASNQASRRKVVVITGANRGLGYQASKHLANRDYHVVMTARDEKSLSSAIGKIKTRHPDSHLDAMKLDISKPDSIQHFSKELSAKFPKIDILINNAAVADKGLGWTKDSFESTFHTNVLGTMLVSKSVLPLLEANENGSMILNISSTMGLSQNFPKTYQDKMNSLLANKNVDIDDLWKELSTFKEYEGMSGVAYPTYSASKYALNVYNQIISHQLQSKIPSLIIYSINPGWCKTDMGGSSAPLSEEDGVDTSVWLCEQGPKSPPFPTGTFISTRKQIAY